MKLISINYTFAKTLNFNFMGKGDKKSKKGKISMGSYGVRRPRKKASKVAVTPSVKKVKPKEEAVVAEKKEKKVSAAKPKTTKKKVE